MKKTERDSLRNTVIQCRRLLEESIAQTLQGRFGIHPTGMIEDGTKLSHLSAEERDYRQDLVDHLVHLIALPVSPSEAASQLTREIAFTHLNRFCAYKMMEARSLIRESVSKGLKSQGFLFYLADHEDDEKRSNSGQQDVAYRHFLNWLGGTLSEEIGVLFNPHDSANRLYPPQRVLDDVLNLLNDEALADIWTQDETIGWVYQYFTPKELRDQVRKESQAPRNSYELAFRNQFFTPRYVVEFLTDNTLGRIWYEMRKGDTKLKDQCRYMVRRPTELFLTDGEQPPENAIEDRDDLSQEGLLKLPVHIPHRPKKDPRELKILDPACGSGHFLLYCFDLLLTIYEEAYTDPELGPALQQDYPTLDALKRDVPRLLLANNLHGIDIDLRASQIAALALWLRSQRAYQEMGLKKDRPKITRSNFVCAEPMPGEPAMLKEFVGQLEPRLLGQLVEVVFDKMKLAGEAGSLLKIEEEIRTSVASAKRQWEAGSAEVQRTLFDRSEPKPKQKRFNLSGVTDDEFFNEAEAKVVDALRTYAEKATNGRRLQRRLFTEDAVRGFAFVDLCHDRFDVVLMNPPFGSGAEPAKAYTSSAYPNGKSDVFACFVERAAGLLISRGLMGAITNRTGFFLSSLEKWRTELFLGRISMTTFADLGHGVLDTAMVETAAYTAERGTATQPAVFFRVIEDSPTTKDATLADSVSSFAGSTYVVDTSQFACVPGAPFAYWVNSRIRRLFTTSDCLETLGYKAYQGLITADDARFLRLDWECPEGRARTAAEAHTGSRWARFAKGGEFSPFFSPLYMAVDCKNGFRELIDNADRKYPYLNGGAQKMLHAVPELFFEAGLNYTRRTSSEFSVRALPKGCVFSDKGPAIIAPKGKTDDSLFLLSVLNSRVFRGLLSLSLGAADAAARSYETGIVSRVPLPSVSREDKTRLGELASDGWALQRNGSEWDETLAEFRRPALVAVMLQKTAPKTLSGLADAVFAEQSEAQVALADIQKRIDVIVAQCYGLDDISRECLNTALSPEVADDLSDTEGEVEPVSSIDVNALVLGLVSCCVGVLVGRWDVSCLLPQQGELGSRNPFTELPELPPASLNVKGDRTTSSMTANSSLRIDLDGILVDDPDHSDDIVRRVRDVLELVWKDRAAAIEDEACAIIKVKEIRDYFRKPGKGGFWDDHISRYSKSRRKAPIYWLLQSSRKNYSLWLYYHRLDNDLLFKASVNYVEPKIRLEASRLESLRSQKAATGDSGKAAKKIDKEIEKQEDFISELKDFEDKLRRAANLHLEPDLNDGVALNIAPLNELVPWKEAKKYWDELVAGEYEWSSISKQLRKKGLVK